jgi:hypothetical protein
MSSKKTLQKMTTISLSNSCFGASILKQGSEGHYQDKNNKGKLKQQSILDLV